MAKITKVVGARYEKTDLIFLRFVDVMECNGISQSTLTKLIFKYALDEHLEEFEEWIATKVIIVD